ncbi:MAG: hypothetical protein Q9M11_04980, partial [Mariprofundaceae bacterium]|nr:hypothetical protein [Mariprofundaceae bacterium]
DHSWIVPVDTLKKDYDLSAKNPAKQKDVEHLPPRKILELIQEKEAAVTNLLGEIDALLAEK